MEKKKEQLISLNDLSKIIKVPKSTLIYYVTMGLFTPREFIGKMYIFEKHMFLDRYKEIKKYQKQGKSLSEIKQLVNDDDSDVEK
jgi:DNA-binding transcriptional MerR regulator